ncbi:HNH endonuclease [Pseudomarimonas arenosa]|uniref:HNH endonuclease n=1 Tax=Pseudomarimonas arenosa TaxID=2774145 RepID=A0AAW3ZEF4_9GAMM|nr:HNH endonuclease signature motif containing protein [Pseudomarimonas arenosa]MBD8524348.1 HNH endonuclease [Pseudomarimonas arenosa]
MIRLAEPKHAYEHVLDQCIAGVTGNTALRLKLTAAKPDLLALGNDYINRCESGQLHSIAPTALDVDDPDVVLTMKKSELTRVYATYFVGKDKPARKIYTDLLVAAREICPFCGGIGRPRNLDHFLPKSRFPQFSVFPKNLVPSCRDCNMEGKSEEFSTTQERQLIHPHADDLKYFRDQWIFARFNGNPEDPRVNLEYFVQPPDSWDDIAVSRARNHFSSFDLSTRYAIRAAQQRTTVLRQMVMLQQEGLSSDAIRRCLLIPGIKEAIFPNHWQRGLYQALSNSLP